ncbi:TonB-dependent receptor [Phenylobacterium sp. LjRoot225]|uniref:TonB-dependent receptor plug domain-containing protein n=1 Tax=Phenylobacterium sp. LjRoot225 TaxID=3342285 RepID=UPI003ED1483E
MSNTPTRALRWLASAAPVALTAAIASAAHAEDAPGAAAIDSAAVAEIVVTGLRGQPRSVTDSPVPIDVIGPAQLTATGKVGLKQILSSAIPSLTLPAQNGGGTSASVPPYAVQGLTGDYVLVLVNGKRRHPTALINNLATLGGGSTPVDLDFIPQSAIERVEYLRGGAAAQYGSDAIAGVINIILKKNGDGGGSETTVGQSYRSTGKLVQENLDWGARLFGGTIHYALSAFQQGAAPANDNATGVLYPLVDGALDPREATADRKAFSRSYGRSTLNTTVNFAYDFTAPIGRDWDVYSFSTISRRVIKDARGAFRPDDLSSLPAIFPDGFQAYRRIHETDFQGTIGLKGALAGWTWDVSSSFGRDDARLNATNTLNASLGPSVNQTRFYMGKQVFEQWTNNLDATRSFEVGLAKPLDVSWGLEHRWEQFAEIAGEPNSYINGGYQVPDDGTPFGDLYHGRFPQAGLQSFTGTTPADASTHSRNNLAAYIDLGSNVTEAWYVGLAARGEHYDDSSGDSLSGKVSTRYEILPRLAVRGSVNNGFHAPSLAQQWFSTTQNTTVVVNGQGVSAQSKFLPVDSPIAKALGATPLRPETSVNYSIGLTWEPTSRLRFTVDAYHIDIRNRIVKSSPNFSLTPAQVAALGFPGLTSAQFFTNGVNTRTQGIDVVAEYQQPLGRFGQVQWSAIYSGSGTKITRIKAAAANFNALAQRQLVNQTPRYRLALAGDWTLDRWDVRLTNTLYGRYVEPVNNTVDELFHPKWVTDIDISYKVSPRVKIAVGANNLFDVFPDKVPADILAKTANVDSVLIGAPGYTLAGYGLPTSGGGVYGTIAPYGLLGGFYYARIGVKF